MLQCHKRRFSFTLASQVRHSRKPLFLCRRTRQGWIVPLARSQACVSAISLMFPSRSGHCDQGSKQTRRLHQSIRSTKIIVPVRILAHSQQLYALRKLDTLELLNLNLGPAPSPNSISPLSNFDKTSSTWISTIERSCTIEVSRILRPYSGWVGCRMCSKRQGDMGLAVRTDEFLIAPERYF